MSIENPASNKERGIKKFIYRDNSRGGVVVFKCEAEGILEADAMYIEAVGNDPKKEPHIGCSIEEIKKEK
ncbi:MAG: hypothetical protein Q8O83_01590 [bacterium]|nr:hypothetical protein [bacterium]